MNEKLIIHVLTDHTDCKLHDLVPLDTKGNKEKLLQIRQKMIKEGELIAAQKISFYLQTGLSKEELEKIIKVCWRKHRVSKAITAISLLMENHPLSGMTALQQALEKCLTGAKSPDHYYRPRYQEAIPKIMAMTKN